MVRTSMAKTIAMPMPTSWKEAVVIAAAVFIVLFVFRSIASYRRLRAFSGPFWAAQTELWLAQKTFVGGLNITLQNITDKYGSLARIGPNMLVTDDPVIIRRMSAARSPYVRGAWYDGVKLDPDIDNTISEKDEKRHNELRAKVANGYQGKDNPNLEGSIDDRVLDLVHLIEEKYLCTNGEYVVMDWAHVAQPFGYLKSNQDLHDYIKTVRAYMPVLEMQTNIPLVNTILGNRIFRKLLAPTAQDRLGMGKMMGVAKEVASARFGPNAKQQDDMLGSFVKHGLTQAETESEALLQIMVGTDSTATSVRTIFYSILTTPRTFTTLTNELNSALNAGKLTRPVIQDSEARDLPYLQACILEGLRIWPPVASLIYKKAPPEGDTLDDGTYIPGGTNVGYSAWGLHHSKRLYGKDADVFRPERWIEAKANAEEDPETLKAMERSVELVFGSGKYGCLGKTIAFLELNKVFAEMFLRFDFSIVDPQKGFKSRCNGMFMQSEMNVVVYPTSNGGNA